VVIGGDSANTQCPLGTKLVNGACVAGIIEIDPDAPKKYCDYGIVTTAGGGCYEIGEESDCDLEWGIVADKCGRTDLQYCDFGPVHSLGGGCYIYTGACDLQWGIIAKTCGTYKGGENPNYKPPVEDCPAGMVLQGNTCVPTTVNCPSGTTLQGSNCVPIVTGPGGVLWSPDMEVFPALQVQFDPVMACRAEYSELELNADHPCWTTTGGWFYGYTLNGGTIKALLNGDLVDFTTSPSLIKINEDKSVESLIGDGLTVEYYAPAAESGDAPGIAALAVNFGQGDGAEYATNITGKGGYCVTYQSTTDIIVELGWHDDTYGYNTWYATLPAKSAKTVTNLSWNTFEQDFWGAPGPAIKIATDEAISLKFVLKNGSLISKNGTFNLYKLGWLNGCSN
jgi:hypothetical protein